MDTYTNKPVLSNGQVIKLKSWNNDYLCCKTTEEDVTTSNEDEVINNNNKWIVEFVNYSDRGLVIKLKSCIGDYLYRRKKDVVVTSSNNDERNEWILEFVKFNLEGNPTIIGKPIIKLKSCKNDSLLRTEKRHELKCGKIMTVVGSYVGHEWTVEDFLTRNK